MKRELLGLGFVLLAATVPTRAATSTLRKTAQCQLQFSTGVRKGNCTVSLDNGQLTAMLLAPRAEESERVGENMLRNRRNANQPPQDVEIQFPIDQIFSVNYQLWNEVSGGFFTLSVVNIDFSMVEIGFITAPGPGQPNQTNVLKIAADTEFGTALRDTLNQSLNLTENRLAALDLPTATTASESGIDTKAQVQRLLETNECVRCDLRGADLAKADLDHANLEGANLQGANLSRAEMNQAYLVGANLNDATLIETDLDQSKLLQASLVGADLTKAKLLEANLTRANLQNSILTEAKLMAPTLLVETNLAAANLSRAKLAGADLSQANLTGANLEGADLSDWTLQVNGSPSSAGEVAVSILLGTDNVKNFRFQTNLTGANLSGANLQKANLEAALLNNADLSHANLKDAELEETDLTTANLCDAILPDGSGSKQGCS